ncbi:MAG: DNA translocase FtsK [Candidatus Izemoplasmataceae bacterium]
MFKKVNRKLVVEERSEDTKAFLIPMIPEGPEKKPYQKNRFVSPIFGTRTKDEIVIPSPHKRQGDLDRQLDSFRKVPKYSKEQLKEKYGTEYPEFDLISGRNLEEAIRKQEERSSKRKSRKHDGEQISFEKELEDPISPNPVNEKKYETFKEQDVKPTYEEQKEPTLDKDKDTPKVSEKALTNKKINGYKLPGPSLLNDPPKKKKDGKEWINEHIHILNKTFDEFKVGAEVQNFTQGPTVTRYEIALDSGVNVKKITGLADNIKMALAAKEIRIEAPIPGKSTVGIEVPNKVPEIVPFKSIVEKEQFVNAKDPLTVALGLDIDGEGVFTSISKMPHGLVAGATGSGKSVCINTVLMSLLMKYRPEELKLMLIDPKMVELTQYNEIPHLITPVITDAKIATAGLKWAVEEMDRRFQIFSQEMVRDIHTYNEKIIKEERDDYMPFIVIVVDELADLMMVASSSVEESIMRITQKARACGMHLIIATQRPSTDVVKGTIKSNIPTRIAFMVSSYIDSMTIIDGAGADKLLGRGDMLYCESGQPQRRVQGAFISDQEIMRVNQFIRDQRGPNYMFDQKKLMNDATSVKNDDDLLEPVARYIVEQQEASINKISKEFHIGFNRAQKIVEILADLGVVSDNMGSKAREVLVDMEQLEEILKKI